MIYSENKKFLSFQSRDGCESIDRANIFLIGRIIISPRILWYILELTKSLRAWG